MLAFVGLTLPLVVDQAVEAPVSVTGIIYMLLLAYLIFTMTLVLQRKQAGYPLALGLATLSLPLVPILFLSPAGLPGALIALDRRGPGHRGTAPPFQPELVRRAVTRHSTRGVQ